MRKMIAASLVVLGLGTCGLAQATRPSPDLEKENRELKAYVDRLEKRLGELESRLRELDRPKPAPQQPQRKYFDPMDPAPPYDFRSYPYERAIPIPPRAQPKPPSTRPSPFTVPTPGEIPKDWQRREFNGRDFYVIPLR